MALLRSKKVLALLILGASAHAADIHVPANGSIATAIERAAPGDTIIVPRAYYREQLRIDKPLTLRGVGRPTLSGGSRGDVIRVTAPDVTIENFIIVDSGDDLTAQNAGIYVQPGAHGAVIRRCDLAYNLFGLWIEGVADVEIAGNLITGKRDYASAQRGNGIQLYNTTGARILDNHISFVRDGIYVDVSHRRRATRSSATTARGTTPITATCCARFKIRPSRTTWRAAISAACSSTTPSTTRYETI